MSNLIQYIVQDDPEELKKQNVNKKNYFFASREQQEECRYNPYNLIENGRKSLTQDKAQTKEPSNIKADINKFLIFRLGKSFLNIYAIIIIL